MGRNRIRMEKGINANRRFKLKNDRMETENPLEVSILIENNWTHVCITPISIYINNKNK